MPSSTADLTPIRIRGKKRKASSIPSSPSRTPKSRTSTPPALSLERRRLQHAQAHNVQRPPTRLSTLELLPPEILEMIFLKDCNMALPFASPEIGYKLSDPATYKAFCARLFCRVTFSDWDDGWKVPGGLEGSTEDLKKATEIALKMKWMTWDLFERVVNGMLEMEKRRFEEWVKKYEQKSDQEKKDMQLQEVGEAAPPNISIVHFNNIGVTGLRLYLIPGTEIPGKLFRYPCPKDQYKFLKTLIKLGGAVSLTSFDYEVIQNTWLAAIQDKDYRLVRLLMSPGIFYNPKLADYRLAIKAMDGDVAMGKIIVSMGDDPHEVSHSQWEVREVKEILYGKGREKLREERLAILWDEYTRNCALSHRPSHKPEYTEGKVDEEIWEREEQMHEEFLLETWRGRYGSDDEWDDIEADMLNLW